MQIIGLILQIRSNLILRLMVAFSGFYAIVIRNASYGLVNIACLTVGSNPILGMTAKHFPRLPNL